MAAHRGRPWVRRPAQSWRQKIAAAVEADRDAAQAAMIGELFALEGIQEIDLPTETVGWKVPGADVRCLVCGPVLGAERFTVRSVFATKRCTGCGNPVDPAQCREGV